MFQSFDSLEDMQRVLAVRSARATAAMVPQQRALTWGSYAMLPTEGFIVFGYVFTKEEVRLGEIHAGADQEEAEASVRSIAAGIDRGYLFGRWYSPIEPEGELGSNHAVSCWPITDRQFGLAATFDYDARQIVRHPAGQWCLDKFIEFAQSNAERSSSDPETLS